MLVPTGLTVLLALLDVGSRACSIILVDRQRRTNARMRPLAEHDELTGLASRTAFEAGVSDALAAARAGGPAVAPHLVAVDGFTAVNDALAVNLSPHEFAEDIVAVVSEALTGSGLSPGRLEREITETLFLRHSPAVMETLRRLKTLGVRIVMDDFGAGYSRLSDLWKFPFDKLKADRSCFTAIDDPAAARTVLRTITAMGGAMNLSVTAEGIETEAQRTFAREAGYDELQGFLYHRPTRAEDARRDAAGAAALRKAPDTARALACRRPAAGRGPGRGVPRRRSPQERTAATHPMRPSKGPAGRRRARLASCALRGPGRLRRARADRAPRDAVARPRGQSLAQRRQPRL